MLAYSNLLNPPDLETILPTHEGVQVQVAQAMDSTDKSTSAVMVMVMVPLPVPVVAMLPHSGTSTASVSVMHPFLENTHHDIFSGHPLASEQAEGRKKRWAHP
jgi:hypothetical protein